MTGYAKGSAFERRVQAHLERDGYVCVRAAGSKGKADLICIKPGQVLMIQVKLTDPQLPPLERAGLVALARLCGALPIVAHRSKPRGPIAYRQLTGAGPKDWQPFTPDFATEAFSA